MDYSIVMSKKFIDKEWSCGETYESLEWFDITILKPTQEELDSLWEEIKLDDIRVKRDELLKESDFRALPDYSSEHKEAWIQYRQELRDFPSIWVEGMEFPRKPE